MAAFGQIPSTSSFGGFPAGPPLGFPGPHSMTAGSAGMSPAGNQHGPPPFARALDTQMWLQSNDFGNLRSLGSERSLSSISGISGLDDRSTISRASHVSGMSYLGNLRQFAREGKENALENVDPREKQQIHDFLDYFLKELRGEDPDVREKLLTAVRKCAKRIVIADEAKIKALVCALVDLLEPTRPDTNVRSLLSALFALKKTNAFKEVIAERGNSLGPVAWHHFATIGVHALPLIHELVCANPQLAMSFATPEFLGQVFRILSSPSSSHIPQAVDCLRRMFRCRGDAFRTMFRERGGTAGLLPFMQARMFPRPLRLTVVKTFAEFVISKDSRCADDFVMHGGIQVLTQSLAIDWCTDILTSTLEILTLVSDVEVMRNADLSAPLMLAIKAIFAETRDLKNVYNATGFLGNVIVRNSAVKDYIIRTDEGRYIDLLLNLGKQCADVLKDPKCDKKQIAEGILENCLMAVANLNRPGNPSQMTVASDASQKINKNLTAQQLWRDVMDQTNIRNQVFVIKMWERMVKLGVRPQEPEISRVLIRFIFTHVGTCDISAENHPEFSKDLKLRRGAIRSAVTVLLHMHEDPQTGDQTTALFRTGQFNLFQALAGMNHVEMCVALLQLAEVLSKDLTLCSLWSRDDIAIQTVHCCEQSSHPTIAGLGRRLMQKIRIDSDEYVSPLADSFTSHRMDYAETL